MARKDKKEKLGSYPSFLAIVLIALIAVTAAAYSREARNGFLNYDDNAYVYDNPYVRDGLTWSGLRWDFLQLNPAGRWTPASANWHPLTWLSHQTDVALFGWDPHTTATRLGLTLPVPGWHHLAALAFHLANTVLLFLLLRRLTGRLWPPALVAALFALHPLHAESVSWISERKDLLATLFFLLTIWAYAAWTARCTLPRYLLVILLFALGLMSKPMLVSLPFVLLLLDFWPLGRMGCFFNPSPLGEGGPKGRVRVLGCAPSTANKLGTVPSFSTPQSALHDSAVPCSIFDIRRFLPLLFEKLPLFALAAASCLITVLAQSHGQALATLTVAPWNFRWQNALIAPVRYLAKTFWPVDLSFSYQKSALYPDGQIPWLWTAGAAALLLIITAAVLFFALRHGRRYLAVGWFWFLGTLVPVIGLVQVGSQCLADRYTYIPLIGLFIIFAGLAAEFLHPSPLGEGGLKGRVRGFALGATTLLILSALALTTYSQTAYWKDNFSLYTHALEINPLDEKARLNLGSDLQDRFDAGGPPQLLDQAADQFRQVLDLHPNLPQALCDLGKVNADRKRFPEAIALYRRALQIQPDSPETHNNLGNAYSQTGDRDAAICEYEAAVALNPDYGSAHFNLAQELMIQAQALPPEKKAEYRAAVARVLDHYAQTVRLLPHLAEAHFDFGWTWLQVGRPDLALPELLAAARLNPRHGSALFWAAFIMATAQDDRLRDGPLALRCIDQAIQLSGPPPPPADLNVRAIALAACGRFDEAADLARRLLAQAQAAGDQNFAALLQNNLRSFAAHQPLRLPPQTPQDEMKN